jgi:hypothetical protein
MDRLLERQDEDGWGSCPVARFVIGNFDCSLTGAVWTFVSPASLCVTRMFSVCRGCQAHTSPSVSRHVCVCVCVWSVTKEGGVLNCVIERNYHFVCCVKWEWNLGLSYQGKKKGWGFSKIGCWRRYLGLRGKRSRFSLLTKYYLGDQFKED